MPTHTTAAEAEAEAAAIRAHNAKREAEVQQQIAQEASLRATQLLQTAAAEALRHEQDAKARHDRAAGKAKEHEEAVHIALAGDKFDADFRAAREASLCGAGPVFLPPSAPDLAVDPTQAMHTADSPTRNTGHVRLGGAAAVVLGNWFPTGGCFGGGSAGSAADQARRARSKSQAPAGRRRKSPTDGN